MGVLDFIYGSAPSTTEPKAGSKENKGAEITKVVNSPATETDRTSAEQSLHVSSSNSASEPSSTNPTDAPAPESPTEASPTGVNGSDHPPDPVKRSPTRGFSFRALAFASNRDEVKPALSTVQEHEKKAKASSAFFRRKAKVSKSDKRAKQDALIVRSLIVGPSSISPASSAPTAAPSKPSFNKVKSQLTQPKAANKLIAQLRALPAAEGNTDLLHGKPIGPIHAVCLDTTDADAEKRHFSILSEGLSAQEVAAATSIASVATASIEKLSNMFKDMHIINLIMEPDLGLGQPGDGNGLLSGAVPTAETIISGIEQITPQLMALGFATGKAVFPDHAGVYPPTDRMSVLTYWWGLELVLPDSSLHYLSSAQSVSHTMINFLTAMSVMNNGVREILPFVRYIGQFVDFEFNAIKGQNNGQGVVCAATWIMPAAMIPRPWDFADPPAKPVTAAADLENADPSADVPQPSQATDAPTRPSASAPSESSLSEPRPSDATSSAGHVLPALTPIPSLPPVLPEVVISSPNGTENTISV